MFNMKGCEEMNKVIYLSGDEPYLIRESYLKIVSQFDKMLNVKEMKNKVNAAQLRTEFDYFPFMSDKRLIILTDVEEDDLMAELIESVPEYITVLITANLDKRKKFFKTIKKLDGVVEIPKLKEYDIRKWIKSQVKSDSITDLIIERMGIDSMDMIKHEIDKLLCFPSLTLEIAENVIPRSLESDSFKLVNLICEKKKTEGYIIIKEMYERGEYLPLVLNLINRNFSILKMLKSKDENQIKEETGIHPYSIKVLVPFSKRFQESQIDFILKETVEADFDMKNGEDHKLVLEKILGVL